MAKNFIAPSCAEQIKIIARTEDFVVINKPSGLLSVPGRLPENSDSVYTRLEALLGEVHMVHRLDMATSGLMVVALHKQAARYFNQQFRERKVTKYYEAICFGRVEQRRGKIDLPIMVDWPNRPKQKIDYESGKPSLTHFKVMDFISYQGAEATRLQLEPVTGRSHQLRIHTYAIGHPLLGCKFYFVGNSYEIANRLLLHAKSLSFIHPQTLTTVCYDSHVPF